MPVEKTLILIKPDGLKRKLTGLAMDRLEQGGFELVGAKVLSVSEELAKKHYDALKDKPFFANLIKYIRGEFHDIKNSKIVALVYKGENAIAGIRKIVGATNPEDAEPGTIRGSFGRISTKGQFENVVHASGNAEDAEREVKLWFKPDEMVE
ncbi:MAG: nucleoside-diphosphate kinase [Elusimicrobia bacterium CG08_land_8_20_14_0_20_51_18]|nr:MAG: nucleoside-diphosphate kinase [Elusimicrobia bacterium CG08_land_8_20_14_0_20_51_18]